MTGKDGRFYNSQFDYNHDGKLDLYELSMYEDYCKQTYSPRDRRQNPFTLMYPCSGIRALIAGTVWIIGFLTMVAVPPLGALILLAAIRISEKR